MATSKDGQSLIRECEKLILEQHIYLINEYIEQRDYLNALGERKKNIGQKYGSKSQNREHHYSICISSGGPEGMFGTSNIKQSISTKVKRKLPFIWKLLCMKRMGLIIIAIIALESNKFTRISELRLPLNWWVTKEEEALWRFYPCCRFNF